MLVQNAIRWIVALAWMTCALLLERILTLGGITDTSQADQNPPVFLAVGSAAIVAAIAIAVVTILRVEGWAALSIPAAIAYAIGGVWLRLVNDDDSGMAIAVIAACIAGLSWRFLVVARR